MRSGAELFFASSLKQVNCPAAELRVAGHVFSGTSANQDESEGLQKILRVLDLIEMRFENRDRWLTRLMANKFYEYGEVSRSEALAMAYRSLIDYCNDFIVKRDGLNTMEFFSTLKKRSLDRPAFRQKLVLVPFQGLSRERFMDCDYEAVDVYRTGFRESPLNMSHFDEGVSQSSINSFWSILSQAMGCKSFVLEECAQIPCLRGVGFLAEDVSSVVSRLNKLQKGN